ncbi:hypothetical protein RIF29_00283 [Crotalaria pallida]|uniref:Uncharacterized protein n=1 Tax=Crotalaria pallida TaxID=3830 RepID=A0AAN9P752_CROPI
MEEEDEVIECSIPDSSLASSSTECCSIPRGGPIYFPNMVGPSTTLNHFQSSLLHELRDLEPLLCEAASQSCSSNHDHRDHDDLEVNELKVFTDDELMDMALTQVFLGRDENNNNENHPPLSHQSNNAPKSHENNPKRKRKGRGTSNSVLQILQFGYALSSLISDEPAP